MPVGAMVGFIDIEYRLNVVIAGRKAIETDNRISEGSRVDRCRDSRRKRVYIKPKELRALSFLFAELITWLWLLVLRNAKHDVTVERLAAERGRKADFKTQSGGSLNVFLPRTKPRDCDSSNDRRA